MSSCLLSTLLILFINSCLSAIAKDKITSLPGWNSSLPSDQYSGMLQVPNTSPNTRHYHYWLVTSESNPSKAPTVFWFNGGPGASSLLGYFIEQGPFNVNDKSIEMNKTSVPLLFYNEYNWAKSSNIIFLESPAGVGFSYCDGPNGPINSCPNWNDTLVAMDNHDIIQEFFKFYPEYISNDFYIFGESYAGIYVPTLVIQIESDPSGMPPLTGFGVGDGCMGIGSIGGCGMDSAKLFFDFMYGHSQMPMKTYNNIYKICGSSLNFGNFTAQCDVVMAVAALNLGGFNVYDIYDECYLENDEIYENKFNLNKLKSLKRAFNGRQSVGSGINEYECGGEKVTNIYLNNDLVKSAINVPQIPWTWQDGGWNKYKQTQRSLIPYYKEWVNKYRILIYYGDVDSAVPYNGGEEWTMSLGYDILESWRPWTMDGKQLMAGYVQIFDTNNTNFTYVTVRGAGHEVPQFKPIEALKMFDIFVTNSEWPKYVGPVGRIMF